MKTDNVKLGKIYRQKPNARTNSLPEIVVVTKIDNEYLQYVSFEDYDEKFYSSDPLFRGRYFEVKEKWHMKGIE